MDAALQAQTSAARTGEFTYLAASVENSLYRNRRVFTRRDASGNDSRWQRADLEERQMPVHDARDFAGAQRRTLNTNGFEVLERPLEVPVIDFLDHDKVVHRYYPRRACPANRVGP